MQCGFDQGSVTKLLDRNPDPTEEEIKALVGNLLQDIPHTLKQEKPRNCEAALEQLITLFR
jgi:hypothetical protein